ncbi:MAG: TAT-variant-translocated molybdopterin oxidoreductase, partial [Acidobacteria bacterium]|nr:TAT-variant-translocated molybdopterin oxidoreductase [Acidobacteriota bacterium]
MSSTTSGARYWRSLDDLAQTPEFQEMVSREFPGEIWESIPPATRRQFLKVMGASLALAGLTSCRWPSEEIVPFAHRPAGSDPGVPKQYATLMETGGAAQGLLVTSYDGRPIKVEGNPNHPDSLGAASAFAQAAILGIYDPDRSRSIVHRQQGQEFAKTWADFKAFASGHFAPYLKRKGGGLAVLAEPSSSPTLARLRARFLDVFPEAVWAEHTPCTNTSERDAVARLFGRPLRPVLHLDRARVVGCFAADPVYDHPSALRHARGYARARRPEEGEKMMRLYAAEPTYSLTGGLADERIAVAPSALPALVLALVRELVSVHGLSVGGVGTAALSRAVPPTGSERFVSMLARDLAAGRDRALLVAGAGAPAEVHILVHAVNAALGAVGTTVDYIDDPDAASPAPESIVGLAQRLRAGQVSTLIILGGNPAYDAPADLGMAKLLDAVQTSIHLSGYKDETSRRCTWHVPAAHFLEAWGDARAWDGTLSVAQPLIAPLYDGRSAIELVATILGDELANGYDLVRQTLRVMTPAGAAFEQFWHDSLNEGVVAGTASKVVRTSPRSDAVGAAVTAAAVAPASAGSDSFELQLVPDRKVYDGRYANSGWLQELPDPITKVTWDNALLLSVADAGRLGVKNDDVVRVEAAGAHVELSAYVLPGQADGVATTSLGYGRKAAGVVGDGVGADTYRLRTTSAPHVVAGARLTRTGRRHKLAC